MANLVVASVCNLKCSYCFASDYLEAAKQASKNDSVPVFIPLDTFEKHLDFLDRSGIDEIRLIGGEPTLHPNFTELIARSHKRGKHIVIFSHGLISEHALNCLLELPPEDCTMLVNTNATRNADGVDDKEWEQRRHTIARLGQRAILGFTIFSPDFQIDHLFPLIIENNCRKVIRLGLAQPIFGGQNKYLSPKRYRFVGSKIAQFARIAASSDIHIDLDCGFTRCMFDENDVTFITKHSQRFASRCNPILDVNIDGQIIHCFPLTGEAQIALTEGANAGDIRAALAEEMKQYREIGVYQECSICNFKYNNECMGGCLAIALNRLQNSAIHIKLPEHATSLFSKKSIGG